ncbi:MAG: GNAT family N-acetyltransferase [bacterium]
MAIIIRPITEADLRTLAKIYVDVYTAFNVGETWTIDTSENMLRFWFKHFPDLSILAILDDKIVGAFLVGVKPWCDGNHLIDGEIFVHPDYQKKHIGSELIKEMFKIAKEKYQVVLFDTYTFRNFKHPFDWYMRLGFKEIKEWAMISGNINDVLEKLE